MADPGAIPGFFLRQTLSGLSSTRQIADAAGRVLGVRPAALVTDLDGTISPIALTPSDASVPTGCREALAGLSQHLEVVAVLTGREPALARAMIGVDGVEYFGDHGLVRWMPDGPWIEPELAPFVDAVARAVPRVRELSTGPGVLVEEKLLGIAVHYRRAPRPRAARLRALRALREVAAEYGLALVEGRMVVELRPPAPLGKGWRLANLAAGRDLRGIVYLGDDVTDVDAFRALRAWREADPGRRSFAIAVDSPEAPLALRKAADAVLEDVAAVEEFLCGLAAALDGAPSAL